MNRKKKKKESSGYDQDEQSAALVNDFVPVEDGDSMCQLGLLDRFGLKESNRVFDVISVESKAIVPLTSLTAAGFVLESDETVVLPAWPRYWSW